MSTVPDKRLREKAAAIASGYFMATSNDCVSLTAEILKFVQQERALGMLEGIELGGNEAIGSAIEVLGTLKGLGTKLKTHTAEGLAAVMEKSSDS